MIIEWVGGVLVMAMVVVGLGMSAMLYPPLSELFGTFPYRVRTNKRVLALTFDDGPNTPYTDALLNVLKKHGVHATFFLVGKNLERYSAVGRRVAAEGHSIGNHTYSHRFFNYFSKTAFVRDVVRNQNVIRAITGVEPTLFRPPWLFRFPWILNALKSHGLKAVSAEFGYELEVIHQQPQSIYRRAVRKARPGMIMDFHDGYNAKGGDRGGTVEAIDQLIPELKDRGFSFVTVDELFLQSST